MNLFHAALPWFGAVLGFGFLVLIHELGHFLALRWRGHPVFAFSIGFGNPWWRFRWRETEFRVGWIPLGGYVLPEDPDEIEKREAEGGPLLKPMPVFDQVFIAIMGPVANLFFAVCLTSTILSIWGDPTPVPVIQEVIKGGAASRAGVLPGDRILDLDGDPIRTWEEFLSRIQACGDKDGRVGLERAGTRLSLLIRPEFCGGRFVVGVKPCMELGARIPFPASAIEAVRKTGSDLRNILVGLFSLFAGGHAGSLAGPIAILEQTSQAAGGGWVAFLTILAILSLNLGVFNLLPFPPLDGARITLAMAQFFRGRLLSDALLLRTYQLGAAGLAILFLFVTIKDVFSIFL